MYKTLLERPDSFSGFWQGSEPAGEADSCTSGQRGRWGREEIKEGKAARGRGYRRRRGDK